MCSHLFLKNYQLRVIYRCQQKNIFYRIIIRSINIKKIYSMSSYWDSNDWRWIARFFVVVALVCVCVCPVRQWQHQQFFSRSEFSLSLSFSLQRANGPTFIINHKKREKNSMNMEFYVHYVITNVYSLDENLCSKCKQLQQQWHSNKNDNNKW